MGKRTPTFDIHQGLGLYRWGDSRTTIQRYAGRPFVPMDSDDMHFAGAMLYPDLEVAPGLRCLVALFDFGRADRSIRLSYDEAQEAQVHRLAATWGASGPAGQDTTWSIGELTFELLHGENELRVTQDASTTIQDYFERLSGRRRKDVEALHALILRHAPRLPPFMNGPDELAYGRHTPESRNTLRTSKLAIRARTNRTTLYVNAGDDDGFLTERFAKRLRVKDHQPRILRFDDVAALNQKALRELIAAAEVADFMLEVSESNEGVRTWITLREPCPFD